jgi:hypothetical protein
LVDNGIARSAIPQRAAGSLQLAARISDCGFRISDYDLNGFNGFNDLNGLGNGDGIFTHIFASVKRIVCQL